MYVLLRAYAHGSPKLRGHWHFHHQKERTARAAAARPPDSPLVFWMITHRTRAVSASESNASFFPPATLPVANVCQKSHGDKRVSPFSESRIGHEQQHETCRSSQARASRATSSLSKPNSCYVARAPLACILRHWHAFFFRACEFFSLMCRQQLYIHMARGAALPSAAVNADTPWS